MSRDEDRAEIEAINAAAGDDPWSVLTLLGADLTGARRQRGAGVLVRCISPTHDDRGASMSVRPLRGGIAILCFGCGVKAGDFPGAVAIREGLDPRRDFAAAKRRAAELVGVSLERRNSGGSVPRQAIHPVLALVKRIDSIAADFNGERLSFPDSARFTDEALEAGTFDVVLDALALLRTADEMRDEARPSVGDRREQARLEAFEAMAERFARWGWTHHDAPGVAVDWKAIDAEQAAEARALRAARIAADLNRRAGRAAA